MSATHNRLTNIDRDAITTRIAETLAVWDRDGWDGRILVSVALSAIGCDGCDMRESELVWLDDAIRFAFLKRAADGLDHSDAQCAACGLEHPADGCDLLP